MPGSRVYSGPGASGAQATPPPARRADATSDGDNVPGSSQTEEGLILVHRRRRRGLRGRARSVGSGRGSGGVVLLQAIHVGLDEVILEDREGLVLADEADRRVGARELGARGERVAPAGARGRVG